tara:strand:+ start:1943 stop:2251 length:309 start_codon:yes stop_codon:yes gene_type:complete
MEREAGVWPSDADNRRPTHSSEAEGMVVFSACGGKPRSNIASRIRSTAAIASSSVNRIARSRSSQNARTSTPGDDNARATSAVTAFMKLLELEAPMVDAVVT